MDAILAGLWAVCAVAGWSIGLASALVLLYNCVVWICTDEGQGGTDAPPTRRCICVRHVGERRLSPACFLWIVSEQRYDDWCVLCFLREGSVRRRHSDAEVGRAARALWLQRTRAQSAAADAARRLRLRSIKGE